MEELGSLDNAVAVTLFRNYSQQQQGDLRRIVCQYRLLELYDPCRIDTHHQLVEDSRVIAKNLENIHQSTKNYCEELKLPFIHELFTSTCEIYDTLLRNTGDALLLRISKKIDEATRRKHPAKSKYHSDVGVGSCTTLEEANSLNITYALDCFALDQRRRCQELTDMCDNLLTQQNYIENLPPSQTVKGLRDVEEVIRRLLENANQTIDEGTTWNDGIRQLKSVTQPQQIEHVFINGLTEQIKQRFKEGMARSWIRKIQKEKRNQQLARKHIGVQSDMEAKKGKGNERIQSLLAQERKNNEKLQREIEELRKKTSEQSSEAQNILESFNELFEKHQQQTTQISHLQIKLDLEMKAKQRLQAQVDAPPRPKVSQRSSSLVRSLYPFRASVMERESEKEIEREEQGVQTEGDNRGSTLEEDLIKAKEESRIEKKNKRSSRAIERIHWAENVKAQQRRSESSSHLHSLNFLESNQSLTHKILEQVNESGSERGSQRGSESSVCRPIQIPNLTDFNQPHPNLTDFNQPHPNLTDFNQPHPNLTDFNQPHPNLTDFNQPFEPLSLGTNILLLNSDQEAKMLVTAAANSTNLKGSRLVDSSTQTEEQRQPLKQPHAPPMQLRKMKSNLPKRTSLETIRQTLGHKQSQISHREFQKLDLKIILEETQKENLLDSLKKTSRRPMTIKTEGKETQGHQSEHIQKYMDNQIEVIVAEKTGKRPTLRPSRTIRISKISQFQEFFQRVNSNRHGKIQ